MNLLENANLASFFRGLDHTITDDGYTFFYRLEKDLVDYYTELGEPKEFRAKCPAGICCKFYTEGDSATFKFKAFQGARKYFTFDIFINDLFIESYKGLNNEDDQEFTLDFSTYSEKIKVEVYFPNSRIVGFSAIDIDSPQPVELTDKFYLALGDSITQGMDASLPSTTYAVQLSRLLGWDFLNQGVGGHIFDYKTAKSIDRNPDLITVALGTNDYTIFEDINELSDNIEAYFTELKKLFPENPTHIITPIWRDIEGQKNKQGNSIQDIRDVIANKALEFDYPIIDGLKLVPNQNDFFADGVHPNDAGFLHYALGIAKALKF